MSAAWAVADPSCALQIEQAHETAIDRALDLRDPAGADAPPPRQPATRSCTRRRPGWWRRAGGTRPRVRSTEQVPDPQLHSHVLLHAAVRRDGRLVAIDSRSWLVHQREVGAAYRTELAHELHALGFSVVRGTGRGGRYFEIDGDPTGDCSTAGQAATTRSRQRSASASPTRSATLEAIIAQGGPDGEPRPTSSSSCCARPGSCHPKQERLMGTITRNAQDTGDRPGPRQRVAARPRCGTASAASGSRCCAAAEGRRWQPAGPDDVLVALTEFDATFAAREARAVALERSAGAPIQHALEQLRDAAQHAARSCCSPTGPAPPKTTAGMSARSSRSPNDSPPPRSSRSPTTRPLGRPSGSTESSPRSAGGCLTSSAPRSSWRAASTRWW